MQKTDWMALNYQPRVKAMKMIQKTAGNLFRGIQSIGTTFHLMTGGVSVRTEYIPLATHVGDFLSLQDV